MYLVLIRHGESEWNKENRFTGWTDVELSEKGIEEAKEAGKFLKEKNINFNVAYTSYLKRAQHTLDLVLESINKPDEIVKAWQLNERHYGALQGLNKDEMRKKYGKEQVEIWRRSYAVRPLLLEEDDKRNPKFDPLYEDVDENLLPLGESLEDTCNRVVPYYEEKIKLDLESNKNVLVVAHGNSLRALIKYIENISDEDIVYLEIPTGVPIIYKYNLNDKSFEKQS